MTAATGSGRSGEALVAHDAALGNVLELDGGVGRDRLQFRHDFRRRMARKYAAVDIGGGALRQGIQRMTAVDQRVATQVVPMRPTKEGLSRKTALACASPGSATKARMAAAVCGSS